MVFGRRTVGDSELNGVGYGFGVGLSYFELRRCRSGPDPGCLRPGKNDRASCEGRCGDESDELDRWGAADSGPVWHGARAGQVNDVDNGEQSHSILTVSCRKVVITGHEHLCR